MHSAFGGDATSHENNCVIDEYMMQLRTNLMHKQSECFDIIKITEKQGNDNHCDTSSF